MNGNQHQQQLSELTPKQQQEYSNKLMNDNEFLSNRSPFYQTLSRHCIMPIMAAQLVNFQFNLPTKYVNDIHQTLKKKDIGKKTVLHIRLFNLNTSKHINWFSESFALKVNSKQIDIQPEINNNKKKKKKKLDEFEYIQPLDISKYAATQMLFEITCKKSKFYGAASIEIVNLLTTAQVAEKIIIRSDLVHTLHQNYRSPLPNVPSAAHQKCKICGSQKNPSRCSRCKSIWYCSREHQQIDWNTHNLGCLPYAELYKLKLTNKAPNIAHNNLNTSNEDIICNEIRISLKDPLSLSRIDTPIRGINCYHPQCIDLKTFLLYSHNCKLWRCPICMKRLIFDEIVIDKSMRKILNDAKSKNVDQVRLNPDNYSFKIITLKEIQKEDGFDNINDNDIEDDSNNNNNKRKLNDNDLNNDTINEHKSKRRRTSSKLQEIIILD